MLHRNTEMMRWWVYYSVFNVYVSQFYRANIWLHGNGFERSAPGFPPFSGTTHKQFFFCWPLSLSSFLFFSRFVCERRCLECQHNISIPFSVCSILEFDLKTKAKANMTTVLCNMHRALVSDAKHSTCQHLYGLLKISFQFNVLYLLTAWKKNGLLNWNICDIQQISGNFMCRHLNFINTTRWHFYGIFNKCNLFHSLFIHILMKYQ